jgi:hypothetical protein
MRGVVCLHDRQDSHHVKLLPEQLIIRDFIGFIITIRDLTMSSFGCSRSSWMASCRSWVASQMVSNSL